MDMKREIATGTVSVQGRVLTHIAKERAQETEPVPEKLYRCAELAIALRELRVETASEPAAISGKKRKIATGTVITNGRMLTHISEKGGRA
jgi:hypothetical protein